METKICNKCKRELPMSFDYFTKTNKGDISALCKECKSKYDKEYRIKNKEKIVNRNKEYYKNNTDKAKQRDERVKKWRRENKERVEKYRLDNKEKIREKNKNYWEENKDEEKSRTRIWREQNKDRIKNYRQATKERSKLVTRSWYCERGGNEISRINCNKRRAKKKELVRDFSKKEWEYCKDYFRNENGDLTCAYCGEVVEKVQQEHFIPLSKNGNYTKDNILPACGQCNQSKNNTSFDEWYITHKGYSIERKEKILKYLELMKEGQIEI